MGLEQSEPRLFLLLALLLFCGWQAMAKALDLNVPRRLIVKLNSRTSLSLEDFKDHLAQNNVSYRIVYDYTKILPDVLYGLSIIVDSQADVAKLEASEHVERLYPVSKMSAVKPVQHRTMPSLLNLTSVPYPPHVQTGISKLHKLGHYGEGVKIAVIDGPVDCSHPALGGGFGKGFKISFGRDLVGDNSAEPKPNPTPCGTCAPHASHVMGILGASDVGQGFTGVVPHASLGIYRVFSCNDTGASDDLIIAAMLHAHKDGADIISASLGAAEGWGEGTALIDTINKLVQEKGATIIVAAGNDGEEGLFYSSNPASAKNALSVGSLESKGRIAAPAMTSTGRELGYYYSSQPFEDVPGGLRVYRTANSTNEKHDACSPLPSSTPDLTNYTVLIQRGKCTFMQKAENARAKGAKRILFFMNSTQMIMLALEYNDTRLGVISKEEGTYVFQESKRNPKGFRLRFPRTPMRFLPYPDAGFMSNFSTFGPSFDFLSPQPAVSGVGGEVLSAFPQINGSYGVLSGTSMATPQIAGIAALVMSVRGKHVRGLAMRSRLVSTSRPVRSRNNLLEPVVKQGGGLADAYCAVFSNTTLSNSFLALNDSRHFNGTQTFTILNEGQRTVNYLLSHVPATTAYTFAPNASFGRPSVTPVQDMKNVAPVRLSSKRFLLSPGKSHSVTVTVRPPNVNPDLLAVYSGYIKLVADTPCESHHLPYYGVAGSIKFPKIIDRGPSVEENETYHYPYIRFQHTNETKSSTNKAGELMWSKKKHNETYIAFRTNFGSPLVRFYIIPGAKHHSYQTAKKIDRHQQKTTGKQAKSTNVQRYHPKNVTGNLNGNNVTLQQPHKKPRPVDSPQHSKKLSFSLRIKNFLAWKTSTPKSCSTNERKYPRKSCDGFELLGEVPDVNDHFVPRSPSLDFFAWAWNGTILLEEGKPIKKLPHGKYRILMKALHLTSDPKILANWETWVSPVVVLRE